MHASNSVGENKIVFADNMEAMAVLGRNDENLRAISEQYKARLTARGDAIIITGEPKEVQQVSDLINGLITLYRAGNAVTLHDVKYSLKAIQDGSGSKLNHMFTDIVVVTARGRQVKPKTLGQHRYLQAIRNNYITFGIGPAGTGKTYLAVAMAVFSLKNKETERIILTRPAVEAGEKLGFLPGDLQEKVDPYLRPLYDALYDILGADTVQKYMARNIIEVAPLAYMRGRTLNDSFIILDEAQNTTPPQMKMFLTRLGFGSKMVVTGDITQVDLPNGSESGLKQAKVIFNSIDGIECVEFNDCDVVRHEIVGRIIRAYEKYEQK